MVIFYKKLLRKFNLARYARCLHFQRRHYKNWRRLLPDKIYKSVALVLLALQIAWYFLFDSKTASFLEMEKRMFEYNYSGANLCGNFSCFGDSMCEGKQFRAELDQDSAYAYRSWFHVTGSVVDKYRRHYPAKFQIPAMQSCNGNKCKFVMKKKIINKNDIREMTCKRFGKLGNCDIAKEFYSQKETKLLLKSDRLLPDIISEAHPFTCATLRMADRAVRRATGSRITGSVKLKNYSEREKVTLLFKIMMAPGSVVQQMFPNEEGWLFEKTMGTCGNVVVSSNLATKTLLEMYSAPWHDRIDLAVQAHYVDIVDTRPGDIGLLGGISSFRSVNLHNLLDLANFFSENDSGFTILMHKLTPLDFGVSLRAKLGIRSADSVMIVDSYTIREESKKKSKSKSEKKFKTKRPIYEAKFDPNTIEIQTSHICQSAQTDINYYAICRNILGGDWISSDVQILKGGLLHDSIELETISNQIYVLLDLCIRGSAAVPADRSILTSSVRRLAAGNLRKILATVRGCSKKFAYRYPECQWEKQEKDLYKLPNFELNWMQ